MEDLRLFRALRGVDRGFYVDVGSRDPSWDSVTRGFYDLGWSGINIEPAEAHFERTCMERPRDTNLRVAALDHDGVVPFFEVSETGLSTIDPSFASLLSETGIPLQSKSIAARTLESILDEHDPVEIHFLKIHAEGAQGRVLGGLDLARHRPWIIVVELNPSLGGGRGDTSWEATLFEARYTKVLDDGLNSFYAAAEHPEVVASFLTPPNVLDLGCRASEWFAGAMPPRSASVVAASPTEEAAARIDGLTHRTIGGDERASALAAGIQLTQQMLQEMTATAELERSRRQRLEEELAAVHQRLRAEQATSHEWWARADEAIRRVAWMRRTWSWRITGPLRTLARLPRSIDKRLAKAGMGGAPPGDERGARRFFSRLRRSFSKRYRRLRGFPPLHAPPTAAPRALAPDGLSDDARLIWRRLLITAATAGDPPKP